MNKEHLLQIQEVKSETRWWTNYSLGRRDRFYRVTTQPKLERVRERKQRNARDHVCCSKEEWGICWQRCGNPETHRREEKDAQRRKTTTEGAEQRNNKMHQRKKKNEKTSWHWKNTWRIRRCPKLSRESKQQRRESSSRKSRTKKTNASLSKWNRRYLWRMLQETLWRQWKRQLWTWNEGMTKEYLKSRLKNFKVQSANSKLTSLQTEVEYELKTSKIAAKRREKLWDKSSMKS